MSEQEIVRDIAERVAAVVAEQMRGIVPDRIYEPETAARLIGITSERRAKTIRAIPRELLPDVPVTPNGRIVGYLGRDLIAYIESRRRTE
jgi:hypothetical protein